MKIVVKKIYYLYNKSNQGVKLDTTSVKHTENVTLNFIPERKVQEHFSAPDKLLDCKKSVIS